MFQKKCETCAIYVPSAQTCQIMGSAMQGKIKPTDFCSKHIDIGQMPICSKCQRGTLEPIIEKQGNEYKIYCPSCYNGNRIFP